MIRVLLTIAIPFVILALASLGFYFAMAATKEFLLPVLENYWLRKVTQLWRENLELKRLVNELATGRKGK